MRRYINRTTVIVTGILFMILVTVISNIDSSPALRQVQDAVPTISTVDSSYWETIKNWIVDNKIIVGLIVALIIFPAARDFLVSVGLAVAPVIILIVLLYYFITDDLMPYVVYHGTSSIMEWLLQDVIGMQVPEHLER